MSIVWTGRVAAVEPRIHLMRSYDERWHEYLGYVLRVDGRMEGSVRKFSVAIGKAAHAKHGFRRGDVVKGRAEPFPSPDLDWVDLHTASALAVVDRAPLATRKPPPWHGVPPPLETYRERGPRRLDVRTYHTKCDGCQWGVSMAVTMIIDHWKPDIREYRTETFCYGPKSCRIYRAGAIRVVPGRRGMTYEEEDWVDEEETSHRND
jgi:hypothetical protein